MRGERLAHAHRSEALGLPETGTIAVLRPRAGDDLHTLEQSRTIILGGFRPDLDHFEAEGWKVARAADGPFAAVLVCLPRSREHGRTLISVAMQIAGQDAPVFVDGQKTDGVDTMLRDLRKLGLKPDGPVSKAHGKIFSLTANSATRAALAGWMARPRLIDGGFVTLPGCFSADGPDRGSALLAENLPARLPARVADLGAGWGYLARAALAREGVAECHLIEAEADALDCARRNIDDARARFHWADARHFKAEHPFDAVICNPPFHEARKPDPALGMGFINAAARLLTASGSLWLVANRHLPYERQLAESFKAVEILPGDPAFRLYHASRPTRLTRN